MLLAYLPVVIFEAFLEMLSQEARPVEVRSDDSRPVRKPD
jgi:hypothetical protein